MSKNQHISSQPSNVSYFCAPWKPWELRNKLCPLGLNSVFKRCRLKKWPGKEVKLKKEKLFWRQEVVKSSLTFLGFAEFPWWVLPIASGDEWGHGIKGHFRDNIALHALSRSRRSHSSLLPFSKSLDPEPPNNVSFAYFVLDSLPAPSPGTSLQPHPRVPSTPSPAHRPLSIHTPVPQSCPVE